MNCIVNLLTILIIVVCLGHPCFVHAVQKGLSLKEKNKGSIEHTIVLESLGQFRLAFEASYNYGLSQWFDLVNDPARTINMAYNPTSYIPAHQQPALFNQVINPGDLIGHIISAKIYLRNIPREFRIIERNNVRCVVIASFSPMIGTNYNKNINFEVQYTLYPTGKIYIRSTLQSMDYQEITLWRNSVIGLGDPSFMTAYDSGNQGVVNGNMLTDTSKNWQMNKWQGYRLNQTGYNSWEVVSNTSSELMIGRRISGNAVIKDGPYSISSRHDKYGWIRATDHQDPFQWHKESAKYLYVYWDPETPQPYRNWAKASILLVPKPGNPFQGGALNHGWQGFKRFFYQTGQVSLERGALITQYYYMQLGTKGSSLLPDLSFSSNNEIYADDYLGDHKLGMKSGTLRGSGFDDAKGCYTIAASNNGVAFLLDGSVTNRIKPVFEITSVSSGVIPKISVDGKSIKPEVDYVWYNNGNGMLLLQFFFDINKKSVINISLLQGY